MVQLSRPRYGITYAPGVQPKTAKAPAGEQLSEGWGRLPVIWSGTQCAPAEDGDRVVELEPCTTRLPALSQARRGPGLVHCRPSPRGSGVPRGPDGPREPGMRTDVPSACLLRPAHRLLARVHDRGGTPASLHLAKPPVRRR